jgi:hypothetical protein
VLLNAAERMVTSPPSEPIEEKPKRWFTFSLRALLLATGVVGIWFGYYINWKRQRDLAYERTFGEVGDHRLGNDELLPFGLWMVGEDPYAHILMPPGTTEADANQLRDLFPEADVEVFTVGAWERRQKRLEDLDRRIAEP